MRYSCDFSRHREEILHRGFRQLVSEILRGRNEMPGCCLQFQDFIRYCPSGRPAGRFAVECFVFGCLGFAVVRARETRFAWIRVPRSCSKAISKIKRELVRGFSDYRAPSYFLLRTTAAPRPARTARIGAGLSVGCSGVSGSVGALTSS